MPAALSSDWRTKPERLVSKPDVLEAISCVPFDMAGAPRE